MAALSFLQALYQLGAVAGPAVAGLLIGHTGIAWVYGIDALTFLAAIVTAAMMHPIPPAEGADPPGLRSIVEGIRYLRGRRVMQGAYLIDINAMVFGMPRALFPAIGLTVFHGGPDVVGYLFAAPGLGALDRAPSPPAGSAGSTGAGARWSCRSSSGASPSPGSGFSHLLWLALVLLAVAGWADVISAVLRNTILQTVVPEQYRSRIIAIQLAVVQGGPRIGDLESGGVASLAGTQFSVVSGGVACRRRCGRPGPGHAGLRPPSGERPAGITTARRPARRRTDRRGRPGRPARLARGGRPTALALTAVPFRRRPDDMIAGEPLPGWHGRFFHAEHMTFAHYDIDAGAPSLHEHHHDERGGLERDRRRDHPCGRRREAHPAGGRRRRSSRPNTPHSATIVGACRVVVADHPRRDQLPGGIGQPG